MSTSDQAPRRGAANDWRDDSIIAVLRSELMTVNEPEDNDDFPEMDRLGAFAALGNKERLSIDPGALDLLRSAIKKPPPIQYTYSDTNYRSRRSLYLELPLLRADHVLDAPHPYGWASEGDLLHHEDCFTWQPWPGEDEAGELQYELSEEAAINALRRSESPEKLEVSDGAIRLLKEVLDLNARAAGSTAIHVAEDVHLHKKQTKSLSPPLLPLFAAADAASQPTPPLSNLDHAPEPSIRTAATFDDIEELSKCSLATSAGHELPAKKNTEHMAARELAAPLKLVSESSLRSSVAQQDPRTPSRIQVPLTPPAWTSSATASSSKDAPHIIPSTPQHWPERASENAEIGFDELFDEFVEQSAYHAQATVKRKMPHVSMRLPVAQLDFTAPSPPWLEAMTVEKQERELRELMLPISKMKMHYWPGVSKLEGKLPWVPFARSWAHTATEEQLEGDTDSYQSYIQVPSAKEILTAESLTWRRDGMRLFDNLYDPKGDLLHPLFPTKARREDDLFKLVRERKVDLELASAGDTALKRKSEASHSYRMVSPFGMLDRFFEVQGLRHFKRHCTANSSTTPPRPQNGPDNNEPFNVAYSPRTSSPVLRIPTQPSINLPPGIITETPALYNPQHPCTVIFSTTTMLNRELVKNLLQHLPDLTIIERDYSLHRPPRSLSACVSFDDADVTSSPLAGLVFTSVPKIRQRPIPPSHCSLIQSSILSKAQRYEMLHVLACPGPSQVIDERDQAAITSFQMWLAGLEAQQGHRIKLHILPNDEPTTLGRWVAGLITCAFLSSPPSLPPDEASADHAASVKYPDPKQIKLLQDETQWERFLRAAGMNAFAAQAVLTRMKDMLSGRRGAGVYGTVKEAQSPDSTSHAVAVTTRGGRGEKKSSKAGLQLLDGSGLARFVCMPAAARRELFADVCGAKVIGSVSRVLDARWKQ